MPGFDNTGPMGQGAQTGKKLGKCSSGKTIGNLEGRMRQFNRGCKKNKNMHSEEFDFRNNEIIGIKRCRHRLQ